MQRRFSQFLGALTPARPKWRCWQPLTLILIMLGFLIGCSSGGSDPDTTTPCGGSSINDLMNAQVAETITGLTFSFLEGGVFQDTLTGATLTFTLETFNDPDLTFLLATADTRVVPQ